MGILYLLVNLVFVSLHDFKLQTSRKPTNADPSFWPCLTRILPNSTYLKRTYQGWELKSTLGLWKPLNFSQFFGSGVKARFTWAILIAISASGSLLSVIYTCARGMWLLSPRELYSLYQVKQVIGMSNTIPWSNVWKSGSFVPAPRANSGGRSEFPTPKGGLMLHWIFSVATISATSGIGRLTEAIGFPGTLQAYASGWVGSRLRIHQSSDQRWLLPTVFISIGFPFLFLKKQFFFMKPRNIPAPTQRKWNNGAPVFILLRSSFGRGVLLTLYFGFNVFIAIVPLRGPYVSASDTPKEIKGWYYITIVGAIVSAAVIYYWSAFGFAIDQDGEPSHPKRTILRLAGVYPKIQQSDVHEPHYGWRRKVEIIYPENAVVSKLPETSLFSTNSLASNQAICIGSSGDQMNDAFQNRGP